MTILIAVIIVLLVYVSVTDGAATVLSDDRVRNLDITPVLGRGYSFAGNNYQTTCIMIDQTTTPSYNYDYTFFDFSNTQDIETDLLRVSHTFGYAKIKASSEESFETGTDVAVNQNVPSARLVVATMRINRYYTSIREELSPLTADAKTILDNKDYVGFFKSCGANYVRSIRRAQEITAIFKYFAPDPTSAKLFADGLKKLSNVQTVETNITEGLSDVEDNVALKSTMSSSLQIQIYGYGLGGFTRGDTNTLVCQTLAEFNDIMKFAFRTFTQGEDTRDMGMVAGIEFVPWTDNTEFQAAIELGEDGIVIPLGRSSIPKAIPLDRTNIDKFRNVKRFRRNFKCRNSLWHMDMYGYCCNSIYLLNPSTSNYTNDESQNVSISERICQPLYQLNPSIAKNNLALNGEFVARLDGVLSYKMNQLYTLGLCVDEIYGLSDAYDYYVLTPSRKIVGTEYMKSTVIQLKRMLDPFGDYSIITHLSQELDEFVDMYYQPCIAAIFGVNDDDDGKNFMAYGWMTHAECFYLSCLTNNMRWDRKNGGCIPSVIAGDTSQEYSVDDNKCSIDMDEEGYDGEEICKYDSVKLQNFQNKLIDCWGSDSTDIPSSMLDNFCMPKILHERVSVTEQEILKNQCNVTRTNLR